MTNQYGAQGVHRELLAELIRYLSSQYFGKSPLLLKRLDKALQEEFLLYRRPFVESTPAYQLSDGISGANLEPWMRDFFMRSRKQNSASSLGLIHTK